VKPRAHDPADSHEIPRAAVGTLPALPSTQLTFAGTAESIL